MTPSVPLASAVRFLLTGAGTAGELLQIETVNPPKGIAEPMHVHPCQESRAAVRAGTLRFVVDGNTRRLGPGDAITIPAGVPHRFANDGDEDGVAIQELRPALKTAEFFETYSDLAERGHLDQHGRSSLLRSAVLGPEFAAEIRLVRPPVADPTRGVRTPGADRTPPRLLAIRVTAGAQGRHRHAQHGSPGAPCSGGRG